jgi:hypothetical protein
MSSESVCSGATTTRCTSCSISRRSRESKSPTMEGAAPLTSLSVRGTRPTTVAFIEGLILNFRSIPLAASALPTTRQRSGGVTRRTRRRAPARPASISRNKSSQTASICVRPRNPFRSIRRLSPSQIRSV